MGLRKTRQNVLMEEVLASSNVLFDAETFHRELQPKNSKIGIATVYRFLKSCVENGILHTYTCNRRAIYSTNESNHCHFTCKCCGKVSHVLLEKLDFLNESVKGDICHFQVDMTGICENCRKKEK